MARISGTHNGAAAEHRGGGGILAAQILVEISAIDKAQTLAAALSTLTEPSDDSRVYGKRPAPHTTHWVYAARVF